MRRRAFLGSACLGCAALWSHRTFAQESIWQSPPRFARPEVASEEGGLWALMDREETRLRRSPFTIRDARLQRHVQDIVCRLAGDHCPDVRVYLMRTPLFNANMAPNGMMQVWSGLMLRVENEAQLAAVLGHEVGHYLERHTLQNLRDARSRSAFAQVLGLFGAVGALGQLAVLAGMFSHSRDQERSADRIGVELMHKAGYDPFESARIWQNLLEEMKAKPDGEYSRRSVLFASHPPAEERQEVLVKLAAAMPGGTANTAAWRDIVKPFRMEWLMDEIKRGQHEESIALLSRMLNYQPSQPDILFARGEVYRMRAKEKDFDAALDDFRGAAGLGGEPAEAHRSMALIYSSRKQSAEARTSFQHYLDVAPAAPDAAMIRSYMKELPE